MVKTMAHCTLSQLTSLKIYLFIPKSGSFLSIVKNISKSAEKESNFHVRKPSVAGNTD